MVVPPTSSHGQRGADGLTTGESSSGWAGACAATCGACPASWHKTRMALLSATHRHSCLFPCTFCLAEHRSCSLSVHRRRSTGARSCWRFLTTTRFCPARPPQLSWLVVAVVGGGLMVGAKADLQLDES